MTDPSTDPLEVLRLPAAPLAPDPAFAARLRARLAATLDPTSSGGPTMTQTDTPIAAPTATRPSLSPYLVVADARAAVAWYEEVFGGTLGETVEMPDGRLGHAEVHIGAAVLMLADEFPEMGLLAPAARGGTTVSLVLDVADVDVTTATAVERGAQVEREPADMPYGFRAAAVVDPFGHRWLIEAPLATAVPGSVPVPASVPVATDAVRPRPRTAREMTDEHEVYTEPGDIVYVTWMVKDEERTAAFFGELLGWTFTAGSVDHTLRLDGSNLLGGLWGQGPDAANAPKLMYHVPDIGDAVTKVRALGGTATDPELMPYGWSSDCTDDQGMEFWLYTPADADA